MGVFINVNCKFYNKYGLCEHPQRVIRVVGLVFKRG